MGKGNKKELTKEKVHATSTEQIYDDVNAVSVHSFSVPSKENSKKHYENIKNIFNYACTTTRKFGPFTALPTTASPDSVTLWEVLQTRNKPIIRHLKKKSSKLAKSYATEDNKRNKDDEISGNRENNSNDDENNYDEDIDINDDNDDGEEYEFNDIEEDDGEEYNDYNDDDEDDNNNYNDEEGEEKDEDEEDVPPPSKKNKDGKKKNSGSSKIKNKKRSRKH